GHVAERLGDAPAVMIHAVSLGEINATRGLVEQLRHARPDAQIIISTTTATGFARAHELYAKTSQPHTPDSPASDSHTSVIHYPLDFTPAVRRVLDRLRPTVVVLMELEVWPNFLRECERRSVPVVLVNARVTTTSLRRYQWGG